MYEEKEIKYKKRKIDKQKKKNRNIPKMKIIEKKSKEKKNFQIPTILTKINYKLLLFKLLILLLSMILIIFTMVRLKKHNEQQNNKLNENMMIITNAILHYFENNTLPQNIGDSASFMLEEMKNLKLIDDIKDENNKYCNYLNSYIILTKTSEKEFRLKVDLKCSKKEKIQKTKILCNNEKCNIKK